MPTQECTAAKKKKVLCDFGDKSLNPVPHGRNGEITIPPQIGAFDNSVRNGIYDTACVNSEKMGVTGISLICETLDCASLHG